MRDRFAKMQKTCNLQFKKKSAAFLPHPQIGGGGYALPKTHPFNVDDLAWSPLHFGRTFRFSNRGPTRQRYATGYKHVSEVQEWYGLYHHAKFRGA